MITGTPLNANRAEKTLASRAHSTSSAKKFFLAGLSYKTAPVEVRERLAVATARLRCQSCRMKLAGNLAEVVIVSTCNRVEVYGVMRSQCNPYRLFQYLSADPSFDFSPYLYVLDGVEAASHLFSVASGLDSMVLGETEITGQIKQAYSMAAEAELTGPVTNRLFQAALQAGKEVRTRTGIGRGATSVGSVAVELAERIFDEDLSAKTVVIIGAGKMGEACIKHLAKKGAGAVLVVNRSLERASELAREFNGEPLSIDSLPAALSRADIVVSSTGAPHTILHRQDLESVMASRCGRPLFLIDIAVPRDIDRDVEELSSVYLYNVDHLETIVRENLKSREQELARANELIKSRVAAAMERIRVAETKSQKRAELFGESLVPEMA